METLDRRIGLPARSRISELVDRPDPDFLGRSSGLAPANIPVSGEIEATPGRILLRLQYSDDEKPEFSYRPYCTEPRIDVRVGQFTKKIIEVRFADPVPHMASGNRIPFDTDLRPPWLEGLPKRLQRVTELTADIVGLILEEIPPRLRREIKAAADST